MLSSQSTNTTDFIAAFNLLANGKATTPSSTARKSSRPSPYQNSIPNSIIVPSVAESAGLNRFVYIIGQSEHRYVFSSINQSQISLYSEAVFAMIDNDGFAPLWIGDYSSLITRINRAPARHSTRIYVHLLAEGDLAKSHVITDLSRSMDEFACWNYSAA